MNDFQCINTTASLQFTDAQRIALAQTAVRIKAGARDGRELTSMLTHAVEPSVRADVPMLHILDLIDSLTDRRFSPLLVGGICRSVKAECDKEGWSRMVSKSKVNQ